MDIITQLLDFIAQSPTAFHCRQTIMDMVKSSGGKELLQHESWEVSPGNLYAMQLGEGSVIAFKIPDAVESVKGFRLAGAHTDSPAIKLKQLTDNTASGVRIAPVEVYGGPILSSWLDRELGLAGVVSARFGTEWKTVLYNSEKAVAVIPNAAIHFNRTINEGFAYDKQKHLLPLFYTGTGSLSDFICDSLGSDEIGGSDLFLYDPLPGTVLSLSENIFVSPRIDNQSGCFTVLRALLDSSPPAVSIAFFSNHEEVGSMSAEGAFSISLNDALLRIAMCLGISREDFFRNKALSIFCSVDGAHGVHPSYPEYHDSDFSPLLNCGPVIKLNANVSYTTTAGTQQFIKNIAGDIPLQQFIMRSDLKCGSTIGPLTSAGSGFPAVDIGIPMLAMHSARETAGIKDQEYMVHLLTRFFNKPGLE